jgi:hypothetical protein
MSALGSSTSYSKAAAQKSARAGAFVLSMTNFQPSGSRPVSRESNDPSSCRRLAVCSPTALRKADLAQYLTALCEGGCTSPLCWCAVLSCEECHCPTEMTSASSS